jgi:hypothetical protein
MHGRGGEGGEGGGGRGCDARKHQSQWLHLEPRPQAVRARCVDLCVGNLPHDALSNFHNALSCPMPFLRCVHFDDGFSLLNADFRIKCHSARHQLMLTVAIVMAGVFPVGVPLYLGVVLWRRRHALFPRNRARILALSHSPDGVQPTILSVRSELVPTVLQPLLHRKVRSLCQFHSAQGRGVLVATWCTGSM